MLAPPTPPGAHHPRQPGAIHRSPVTLQDLLEDLFWPHLLRAWKLALAPGRLTLAFLFVLVLWTVRGLYHKVTGERMFAGIVLHAREDFAALFPARSWPQSSAAAIYDLFIQGPYLLLTEHPVVTLVYLPFLLLCWCAAGGAICRSCACEASLRAALPWRSAVAFGLRKTPALFAAIAGPLCAVWLAALALKLFGLAFFTTRPLGLLGAAAFLLPLVLCVVVAAASAAYLLAHTLLIPAVACEGTDSFDAVQRCYAYVLARPARVLLYAVIALLSAGAAAMVSWMVCTLAITMATSLTGAPVAPPDAEWFPRAREGYAASGWMVTFWIWVVLALLNAYFISLYFCAATTLYLVVRRLVDGQDITELWTPPVPALPLPALPSPPPLPDVSEKADYT